VILLILVGCRGNTSGDLAVSDVTVRSAIQERDASAVWTRDFAQPAKERRNVPLTQDSIIAFTPSQIGNSVYPELPGFASLDTSNLNQELRAAVNAFGRAVTVRDLAGAQGFAREDTRFFMDIFFTDTAGIKFTGPFLTGKPEIIDGTWQVPLRFFAARGHLDIHVYLMYDDKWVIDQITYGELAGD
jgi:hypothetical protein